MKITPRLSRQKPSQQRELPQDARSSPLPCRSRKESGGDGGNIDATRCDRYVQCMKTLAPRIVLDPNVRFGKPVIQGTRITVEEVLGALAGGMDARDIEREYGLGRTDVQAAIAYAASYLKGEEVSATEPA